MSAVVDVRETSAAYRASLQPTPVRHFDLLAAAPGGVARLREMILSLAIQGKLVPQSPDDEPTSSLVARIAQVTARLVAERKTRRERPVAAIADENLPFDIPNSWVWIRLGDLGTVGSSSRVHQKDWRSSGVPFYRAREIVKLSKHGEVDNELFISEELFQELAAGGLVPERSDIMITGVGTIGVPYVVQGNDRFYFKDASVLIFKNQHNLVAGFLSLFMQSPYWVQKIHAESMGTTVDTLTISRASEVPVPLPPVAEQARIVARVDELMRLCDALDDKGQLEAEQHARLLGTLLGTLTDSCTPEELAASWQRVAAHFNLLLDRPEAVDALEQAILQLAVRGLLVPQDSSDEPATVLLAHIRAEKAQLIADGKIKRERPLPAFDADAAPFALPRAWVWARFPELGEFGRGKSKHRPRNDPALFSPPIYPLVQTGEVARAKGTILEYHSKYSELGLAQSRLWPAGTLCITIAANIADAAVLGFDACFPDSVVGFVPASCLGGTAYFHAFLETAKTDLVKFAPATAQKNINLEILESLLVPLPPKREMERIVARVIELRGLCADLRQSLAASQIIQSHVAEALVAEVA